MGVSYFCWLHFTETLCCQERFSFETRPVGRNALISWKKKSRHQKVIGYWLFGITNKFRTFRVSLMQLLRFNWLSPPPQSWKPASSDPSSHLSQLLSLEGRRLLVFVKIWKSDWDTSMQTENPNIKQSFTTFYIHLYQSLHSREVFLNLLTWFLSRI